jgi:N-acyl homoserine lactone hydrolase
MLCRMGAEIKLYAFSCGTIAFAGAEVPVPFFLIEHPDGNVLVDGGNPLAVAHDAAGHWGPLAEHFSAHMSEEQHCASQLARLGFAPESVRFVVQTHLHMDHTGAIGHFAGAQVIVHARELSAARVAEPPHAHGYIREDFEAPTIAWQTVEGDVDLLGDGTVRLLETPGHSAGHVSLLLTLKETGPVVLSGDATDNVEQWEGRQPLRALSSPEQARRSLERLRQLALELEPLVIFGPTELAGLDARPPALPLATKR